MSGTPSSAVAMNRRLHVLLVSNRFAGDPGAGGTETLTADLAAALSARANRVTWIATGPGAAGGRRQSWPDRDTPVTRIRVPARHSGAPPHDWQARERENSRHLASALQALPAVDVVHVTHFSRLGLDFLDRVLPGTPAVATLTDYTAVCGDFQLVHRHTGRSCAPPVPAGTCATCLYDPAGAVAGRRELDRWRRRNLAVLNDRCSAVWVQTPQQRRQLVAAGLRADRVVGDRAAYAVPRGWRPAPAPDGVPVLLFLGRASVEKGLDVLVTAFMAWRRPARLCLVTTPDDDGYERTLRERTATDRRIEWLRPVPRDDLDQVLNRATCLVVPSQWDENHPLVLHYAMALGIPVLCSAVASLEHLAASGAVTPVRSYRSARAWVEAFDELVDRPARRSTGTASRLRREYTRLVGQTVAVYRRCAADPGPGSTS